MNNDSTPDKPKDNGLDAAALVEMQERRVKESKEFFDKEYKLSDRSTKNRELYLAVDAQKKAEEERDTPSSDNRIFSSIRTVVPYVTSRITEPMVFPSSKSAESKRFAEDMEKALYIHADNDNLRGKVKFAVEDLLIERRGFLKPRYDAQRRIFCTFEYVPCESIIIDHKARPFEEPRYFRHLLDKTVEDLLTMFPDKKATITEAFGLSENPTVQDLQKECVVNEDWVLRPDPDEGLDLVVVWSYNGTALAAERDPNWRYNDTNFLDYHMMPIVPFNLLTGGRTLIDRTSFVEQAEFLQKNINERGEQISRNAGLGSVGMPVVDSRALADDQAQYLTYEPDSAIVLDVQNAGASRISDVIDFWKAGNLGNDAYQDKLDSRSSVDNTFGTPNIMRGEESKNQTASQDIMLRDQAFGRHQELVDAIDAAMNRAYLLMAQFLLVYGGSEDSQDGSYQMFEFVGEDAEFDYIMLNTDDLDTKVKIRVKAGTSMPIDRPQRRATADKAAQLKMIDPLTYWEIMDEGNAQKYAKRLMEFMANPPAFLKDAQEDVFERNAFVDIQLLKHGQQPPFREELDKEYFDYLNHYVLSGDLENPTIDEATRAAITEFIDVQLARGQKMLGMAETQLPTPDEIQAANQQTDQANAADQQAAASTMPGQPPQGGKPTPSPTNPQVAGPPPAPAP